jgi:dsDNA-specific endonuclease/ATPase MutS2
MIDPSVFEKLEFPKILNHISNYSITERGKYFINTLLPSSEINFIK